jgi:hypothetical protein
MKSLRLTWFHLKRILFQNWSFIVLTLAMPLVIIMAFLFIMDSDSSLMAEQDSVVINHSEYVAEKVKPALDENYQDSFLEDADEAFSQLDQIEVSMVYEIPADFPSADAAIQVHSLSGNNQDPLFETAFINTLSDVMINDIYQEADINFETVDVSSPTVKTAVETLNSNMSFVLFMVLFFMGYTTGFIASDLAKMRKEGLLTRSLISNTYSAQILGSVLVAYTIYNVASSLSIILLTSLLFEIPITSIGLIIGLIISIAVFIAGLTMVLFRIFKNENLIQMLGILLMMILVFVPLYFQSMIDFNFIQYISPYYWVFDAIDTGQSLPNIFIITLYGLVLFTAGSFKIERLVKN